MNALTLSVKETFSVEEFAAVLTTMSIPEFKGKDLDRILTFGANIALFAFTEFAAVEVFAQDLIVTFE